MNLNGLKIGHAQDYNIKTGVTVFLLDKPSNCSYLVCGSAPALRDVSTLDLDTFVSKIDALLFSGGSAYGLGATNGVMSWLEEHHKGLDTNYRLVPIVPTAAIYDFNYGLAVEPNADMAYEACNNAIGNNYKQGNIGAGTGACVGKTTSYESTNSGIGMNQVEFDGIKIVSVAVVNSIGDIYKNGEIIAGAKDKNNVFINMEESLFSKGVSFNLEKNKNTVLVANFISCELSNHELAMISKMSVSGISRAIKPSMTMYDGDVIFSISMGNSIDNSIDLMKIGSACATNIEIAIQNAVKE